MFGKNTYVKEIEKIGYILCEHTEFSFSTFSKNFPTGYTCSDIDYFPRTMSVNIKELKKENSIQAFTKVLVAIYHEYNHICQYEDIKSKVLPKEIALEYILKQHNGLLYNSIYSNSTYEISSEYAGVINAYQYLKAKHPECDAYDCIKRYIENQISAGDVRYKEYGFENCKDINEINNCFQSLLSSLSKSKYNFQRLYYDYENYDISAIKEDNLIFKAFDEIGKDTFRQIETALPNGYEQAKFVCAYTLKEHPEYRQIFSKYKAIRRLDFDRYVAAYKEFEKDRSVPYLALLQQINDEEAERDNHDD